MTLWSSEKTYLRQKEVGAGWTPGRARRDARRLEAPARRSRSGVVLDERWCSWAAEAALASGGRPLRGLLRSATSS